MPGVPPEWSSADYELEDMEASPEMASAVAAAREALRSLDPENEATSGDGQED